MVRNLSLSWISLALRLILAVVLLSSYTAMQAEEIKITNWRYQRSDSQLSEPCSVPGTIQDYLIQSGKLPNPHYRQNEKIIQGIEDHDWIYKADINLPEALPVSYDKYILSFAGIDTYSTISINGKEIGKTDNMFVGYEFDVSPFLHRGHNSLEIRLHAPLKMAHPLYERSGINYPADNDHAKIHYSVFTRKAPYSYGWDWGMRMVTMGIWQPVSLRHYTMGRITDVNVTSEISWGAQSELAEHAIITVIPQIESFAGDLPLRIRLKDAGRVVSEQQLQSPPKLGVRIPVHKPKLWWPQGWGKAHLYEIEVSLLSADGDRVLDQMTRSVGLRDVKLIQKPDRYGQSFTFEVNKKPIFIKGSNYIPGENILTRRSDSTFRRLFDDVEFAQMNMIRIWGGGVYEDKRFYDEADRRGILIWQDFMFACTPYPADSAFLENVRCEAEYQVKRLRNHPSVVLWCGNNEIEEGLMYWGWQKRFPKDEYERMRRDYDPIFRQLLPSVVSRLDPTRGYIHSSPFSANWGRPESWLSSDVHYWGLWYGKEPFEAIDHKPMRFASEYGFQSFPDVDALKEFTSPEDLSLESDVMRQHQKASTGNSLIKEYMQRDYVVPTDFNQFVYVGQILQARGMEHVIRTLRRQRPICMGSLYWQLNDAWPAVSWSSIDYYQNYKALHYAVRRSYAPLALLPEISEDGQRLKIYLANDYLKQVRGSKLKVTVQELSGKILLRSEKSCPLISANSLTSLIELEVSKWTKPNICISFELTSPEGKAEYRWYGARTKDLELSAPTKVEDMYSITCKPLNAEHTKFRVQLRAKVYLKDVFLSVPIMGARWSDNLLDLRAGEERNLTLTLPQREQRGGAPTITVRTMNSINRIMK